MLASVTIPDFWAGFICGGLAWILVLTLYGKWKGV